MSSIPDRYIVFDTETSEHVISKSPRHVVLKFRLGVVKTSIRGKSGETVSSYIEFKTPETFYQHIDGLPKEKGKIWVFAHNLGFDIRVIGLFDEVSKGRYSLLNPVPSKRSSTQDTPFVVLDDPPTIIRLYRLDGQELMWVDSWQWLSSSLAKIGQILGNAKGQIPDNTSSDEEWFTYCRQDVDVLDDAMRRIFDWVRVNRYNSFHPTRAGQAKLIYSNSYERRRIAYHNDPDLQSTERPSYYGGFTECFRVGSIGGPIHQLDVNSLYPFVMRANWFPARVRGHSSGGDDTTIYTEHHPKRCIAEVYLESSENSYPVRCREGTIFAKGRVRTILPGPELKAAFEAGDVVRTTRYVDYEMEPLFKEFVDDFYSMRLKAKREGNEIFDYFYKLILNSLYGKFGQLTAEWEFVGATDPSTVYDQGYSVDAQTGEVVETRRLAGTEYRRTTPTDHPKSFVAIASFVTSYAREYMRSIRNMIPRDSYYYQATDSLYVNREAFDILSEAGMINPDVLGKLKHEGVHESMSIYNIHNLDKGSKKVRGSIKARAVDLGDDRYRQEQWESLLPGIKCGHTSEVHIREVVKRMTHRYDRQRVLPDGSCTPYVIDNWETTPEQQAKLWLFRGSAVGGEDHPSLDHGI